MDNRAIHEMLDQLENEFNSVMESSWTSKSERLRKRLGVVLENYTTLNQDEIDFILSSIIIELGEDDLIDIDSEEP